MADLLTSITLGDVTFPVAEITFGQAQAAWAAYETALLGKGSVGGERLQAIKGVILQVARAADPGFDPQTLENARGVKPRQVYDLLKPLGLLLGFEEVKRGASAQGEAGAGATPAD